MGWYEDQLTSRIARIVAAELSAGRDKGKGKGKTGKTADVWEKGKGKGADGKGKGKGKDGLLKVPCLDSRCKVLTNRNESHCHDWWCGAPLNKDSKGGADDA